MINRCVFMLSLALLSACATAPRPASEAASARYKVGAPYNVNGTTYYPREDPGYTAVGVASWYGDPFHGRRTANGEIFDKDRLSAAHTTLPLPSVVEVENLENGRRVTVRVNDRGPFVGDRVIDLSYGAARALGFERQGLAKVRVRYLGRADLTARAPVYGGERTRRFIAIAPPPDTARRGEAARVSQSPAAENGGSSDSLARAIKAALDAPPLAPPEYWIAVAEFVDLEQLESARTDMPGDGDLRIVTTPKKSGEIAYGLQIGPFRDRFTADARLAALREAGYLDALIAGGELCLPEEPEDAAIDVC